jgi:protein-disulfide isomerase
MSKTNRDQNRSQRAAAIQAADARKERNRKMAIVAAIVVVLAAVVAGTFWYSGGGGGSTQAPTVNAPTSAGDHSLVVGSADAKYHVVVYEDFLCPFCREFEMASRDYLHEDAAKGKVQIEYRPFHLLQDDYSVRALNAFAAVLSESPAKALRFHNLLFDKQPYENAADKPDAAKLADWAASVGANKSAVEAAVNANDPTYLNAADAMAAKDKVQGTPTILVNGKALAGSTIANMSDTLEKMIGVQ